MLSTGERMAIIDHGRSLAYSLECCELSLKAKEYMTITLDEGSEHPLKAEEISLVSNQIHPIGITNE